MIKIIQFRPNRIRDKNQRNKSKAKQQISYTTIMQANNNNNDNQKKRENRNIVIYNNQEKNQKKDGKKQTHIKLNIFFFSAVSINIIFKI